jgi:hypothetical protein
MRVVAFTIAVLVLASPAAAASPSAKVERALRSAARTGQVPRTLVVKYWDTGTGRMPERFSLSADGRLRRAGPGPTRTETVRIRRSEVLGVVRLLVRLRAWRQPPSSLPPPMVVYVDFVEISVRGATTRVSDWHTSGTNGSGTLGPVGARLARLFEAHR